MTDTPKYYHNKYYHNTNNRHHYNYNYTSLNHIYYKYYKHLHNANNYRLYSMSFWVWDLLDTRFDPPWYMVSRANL